MEIKIQQKNYRTKGLKEAIFTPEETIYREFGYKKLWYITAASTESVFQVGASRFRIK